MSRESFNQESPAPFDQLIGSTLENFEDGPLLFDDGFGDVAPPNRIDASNIDQLVLDPEVVSPDIREAIKSGEAWVELSN